MPFLKLSLFGVNFQEYEEMFKGQDELTSGDRMNKKLEMWMEEFENLSEEELKQYDTGNFFH